MAAAYHTRSNSFPSRSNPLVSQFDEQLNRIKSSEFASSSSSSSSSSTITSKISLLSDLYNCIDELLQLPSSQTAFSCQSAENVLEKSIKLLDSCSAITDVLAQMKERAQELQSILRRRCSKDEIAREVAQYLKSRKNVIKVVSKTLKDLKKVENEYEVDSNETTSVISKLRGCQMATLTVLESVLVAIAGSKVTSNWDSVVSKLLKSKRVSKTQETESVLVGFEASDAASHPEKVRSGLENMEISIKNVEEEDKILFRHLIKTRTTLLNILNC